MSVRTRRSVLSVVVPGVIVAVLLAITLSTDHPVSGIDVSVVATRCARAADTAACRPVPYQALILVRKPGSHEVVTGHRPGPSGRIRLNLPPGEYVLVPRGPARGEPPGVGRVVRVRVREDRYTPVTVVYRLQLASRPAQVR
jgi:hypothetical protein